MSRPESHCRLQQIRILPLERQQSGQREGVGDPELLRVRRLVNVIQPGPPDGVEQGRAGEDDGPYDGPDVEREDVQHGQEVDRLDGRRAEDVEGALVLREEGTFLL